MNFKYNLKCCVTSPICHLLLLGVGCLATIELVHIHAHYNMSMDTNSYIRAFCKKNLDTCKSIVIDLGG